LKFLFSRRGAALAGVLLLALFLVRPSAGRLRGKIAGSLAQALGKRVEIASVHVRLVPRLGFELENLVVHEDPEFGAEPLLRSPDVTAWLRMTSLFRGRIEVSNLELRNASLNLTRSSQGKWNLNDLLQKTSTASTAPTDSRQARPEFPYIEVSGARINFKNGSEKTHFALTDAEFSLWQESENSWGLRLRARPIRTDANLTDTGSLRINGIWQKGSSPAQTPLQFTFEWKHAQVGQISKLAYGADSGWRGDATLAGTLSGVPEKLLVRADASVDDFRRFDILGGGNLRMAMHCETEYSSTVRKFTNIDCSLPSSASSIRVQGSASAVWPAQYSLSFLASKIPVESVFFLARHSYGAMTGNVDSRGLISGSLSVRRDQASKAQLITGTGEILGLQLLSGNGPALLAVDRVPLTVQKSPGAHGSAPSTTLEIGPVPVNMGRPSLLQSHAILSRSGYRINAHGDAGVKRLLQTAQAIGIPAPAFSAEGSSTIDLTISGNWSDSRPVAPIGTAQLRGVSAQVRGLNQPVQIGAATLILTENLVRVQNLKAIVGESAWRGTLEVPRPCGTPSECIFQFNLHANELSAAALNQLLNPAARGQSWYRMFTSTAKPNSFPLHARGKGKLAIETLHLGTVDYSDLKGDLELDSGRITLANCRGHVFDGIAMSTLQADFRATPPAYSGNGTLQSISLLRVSQLMRDSWVDGAGAGNFEFKTSGWNLQDVVKAADLKVAFALHDGNFPHIVLTSNSEPLAVQDFSGQLLLRKGRISLSDAKLASPSGVFNVSGSASLDGSLNLKFAAANSASYNVTGTVMKTRVSLIPPSATQASLKP
jgi:uncharacterized protein involved in outer membrane biogenesis